MLPNLIQIEGYHMSSENRVFFFHVHKVFIIHYSILFVGTIQIKGWSQICKSDQ